MGDMNMKKDDEKDVGPEDEEDQEEEEEDQEGETDPEPSETIPSRTTEDEKTSKWMLYANLTWVGAFFVMIFLEKWDEGEERDMVMYQAVQQFFITLPMMIPGLNYIFSIVWIVLTIMALVKSNSGDCWEMPFVSEYVHKVLDRDE